jgi:hypothetical protein
MTVASETPPERRSAGEPLSLATYFSLNARTRRAEPQRAVASAWRARGDPAPPPAPEPKPMSVGEQLVLYLGVLAGVLFQPVLTQYRSAGTISFSLPWGLVIISLLIALVVTPNVYEKIGVRRDSPALVRFGLFAPQGLMWQVLLDAAATAAKV